MRHDTTSNQDREFGEELAKELPEASWVLDWIESTFLINEVFDDDDIKKYIKENNNPEDVFDDSELSQWAEENGYIKKE